MEKVNSIIKMEEAMMEIGNKIKWMGMAFYIINPIAKPIKDSGWMINSKVLESYITKIHYNFMIHSIIPILMKLSNIGSSIKVLIIWFRQLYIGS